MSRPRFRYRRIEKRRLRRIANAIVLIGHNFLVRRKYGCRGAGFLQRKCGCDLRMGARQCRSRTVWVFWDEWRRDIGVLEFPRPLVAGCGHQRTERERRSHGRKLIDVGLVFGRRTLQASPTVVRRETQARALRTIVAGGP